MITASCSFCEDVREEVSGQETVVGLFERCEVMMQTSFLSMLQAIVQIHVPFEDRGTEFGVVATDGSGETIILSVPPPEFKDGVFKNAEAYGLKFAAFPVTIGLLEKPLEIKDTLTLTVYLTVGGERTKIGSFTAIPPDPS